jgi:hypothetical protein
MKSFRLEFIVVGCLLLFLVGAKVLTPSSTIREYLICGPTFSGTGGVCNLFTNLPAAFTVVPNLASVTFVDFTGASEFRIIAYFSAAAVTGDLELRCDTDINFGSEVTLAQIANPTVSQNIGAWTPIPANECATAGGVNVRAGMINGDTIEDPSLRRVILQTR